MLIKFPIKTKGELNIYHLCDFKGREIIEINNFSLTFKNKTEIIKINITKEQIKKSRRKDQYVDLSFLNELEDIDLTGFSLKDVKMDLICKYDDIKTFHINREITLSRQLSFLSLTKEFDKIIKQVT